MLEYWRFEWCPVHTRLYRAVPAGPKLRAINDELLSNQLINERFDLRCDRVTIAGMTRLNASYDFLAAEAISDIHPDLWACLRQTVVIARIEVDSYDLLIKGLKDHIWLIHPETPHLPLQSEFAILTSVIIPVFNGQAYLGEAIQSAQNQGVELEIIVVDDGSTDKTGEIARGLGEPRLRYFRQDRMGPAAARNRGVALASGQLISFLDVDDVWLANKLRCQIASLQADEGDMIFAHIEEFISPDCEQELTGVRLARTNLCGPSATTLLIEAKNFERIGGFDISCKMGEFIEWYARAVDLGLRPKTIPKVLTRRRLHRANMTRIDSSQATDYVFTMKTILDRRRSAIE